MGLFSKKSDIDEIIEGYCGGFANNQTFREKLETHNKSKNTPNKGYKYVLKTELTNKTLKKEDVEFRLEELLDLDINALENLIKSNNINSSLIHTSTDLDSEINKIQKEKIKQDQQIQEEKQRLQNEKQKQKEQRKKERQELKKNSDIEKAKELGIHGFDFKCTLNEDRVNWSGDNQKQVADGYVFVKEDRLTIKKISLFRKKDLGDKTIFYNQITSLDFDKAGTLQTTSSIQLTVSGSERIFLKHTTSENYELLLKHWSKFHNKSNTPKNSSNSVDDLMKYAELYEKGLLTEEEFNKKKKELL